MIAPTPPPCAGVVLGGLRVGAVDGGVEDVEQHALLEVYKLSNYPTLGLGSGGF